MIDFDDIAEDYEMTDLKPDKRYSILPTVMSLLGPLAGKVVVDVGCGDGFFTHAIAERGAARVYGLDCSQRQVEKAKAGICPNVEYRVHDMFKKGIPRCDVMTAPFVLNYASSTEELGLLAENFFSALCAGGRLVSVVDMPVEGLSEDQIEEKKRFGAVKKVKGSLVDGAKIELELYNDCKLICKLESAYFSQKTLESVFADAGFNEIEWHSPLISSKGIRVLGKPFWEGYESLCELGYLTAQKIA